MGPANEPSRCRSRSAGVLLALAAMVGLRACGAAADGAVTHALPKTKRSYQVLLPTKDPAALVDKALVVYLHPNGEPKAERFTKEYWPLLRKRTCVVAMPKASSKLIWRHADAQYIMDAIADVRKRYHVDAKRVILMGVSGGGQTALFLVDHRPEDFRAVIAVSTNPVVVRGRRHEWFHPSTRTAKRCPYLVINHITHGAALQYWRQVRAERRSTGASISILPVLGPVGHYQPPPKQLGPWLDAVLSGKHPAPIPDPQKAAVAKMFAKVVTALPKALQAAKPAPEAATVSKDGKHFRLTVPLPAAFERSKKEDETDAAGKPITQVRIEHKKWPITVRFDARKTNKPMAKVLDAERTQTIRRGLLYQVYHTGKIAAGGRNWQMRIGSITYPDRRRGWVSGLFLHANAEVASDPKQWLEIMVLDETQQPNAAELSVIFKTALAGVRPQATKGR